MASMLQIKQINLHHSKSASFELRNLLAVSHTDIGLIQEPYLLDGAVSGLNSSNGSILYQGSALKPRACIFISHNISASLLHEASSADLVAVLVSLENSKSCNKLIFASVYLPFDSNSPPPSAELTNLVLWSKNNHIPLVIGCDANAHHTLWGSSDVNNRGSSLFQYLSTSDLEILNVGSEPTFVNSIRREVIDISLCSLSIIDLILNWRVTDDILTSDHRCIGFNINLKRPPLKPYRNRKLTDWDSFTLKLGSALSPTSEIISADEIESHAVSLSKAVTIAFEKSCPLITKQRNRNKPFWCSDLKKLRKCARKLKNKAKRSNLNSDWASFLVAQKNYKKSLRSAHRTSWIQFCEEINSLSSVARLNKTLARNDVCRLDVLRLPDGRLTSSKKEIGELLLSVHFPGCFTINSGGADSQNIHNPVFTPNWDFARKLVTNDVLRWSLFSFAPFKSGGPDGIFPAELQHGFPLIGGQLLNLFQACIAFGIVPQTWSRSRVVFIPKAGKVDYMDPKSFRPISLSSTFLKALERIVDRFIRDHCLSIIPLSNMQHAYRVGRSCETALHELVTKIEKSLNNKEFLVGTFLDIAGAFDSTSFDTITNACTRFGIDETLVVWIESMLKSRIVETELDGLSVTVKVAKGCPQGGVLSPLLWLLVIDELLVKLQNSGFVVQGYADDLVITISGKYLNILSELTQHALTLVEEWCIEKNLHVNPSKTDLVVFTRRRIVGELSTPLLFGHAIIRSDQVKHLGVILDSQLSWKYHLENKLQKSTAIFWQCRRAFGKSWGLTPKMLMFIYKSLVLPLLSYASVVWWPIVDLKSSIIKLNGLQGIACRAITGSMLSTPLLAMETILLLPQLQSFILGTACSAAYRLRCIGAWNSLGSIVGHRKIFIKFNSNIPELDMVNDRLLPEFSFNDLFSVVCPAKDLWVSKDFHELVTESLVFFSDGSISDFRAGFGTFCPSLDRRTSGSLGKHCTVFQAELIALTHCVIDALKIADKDSNIIFCTDSKSVLNSLKNSLIVSKLVKDCRHFLNLLCSSNNVTVMWVPAHYGIWGNEIADSLAKTGSKLRFTGPEPVAPLSFNIGKSKIKNHSIQVLKQKWRDTSDCRVAKHFVSGPHMGLTKYALSLNKESLRILVAILTGHGRFKIHLQRMGLAHDSICDDCLEADDDCIHYICRCPAFDSLRLKIFNYRCFEEGLLSSMPWSKFIQFSKAALRTCDLG